MIIFPRSPVTDQKSTVLNVEDMKKKSCIPKIIGNLPINFSFVFPLGFIVLLINLLHTKTVASIIY